MLPGAATVSSSGAAERPGSTANAVNPSPSADRSDSSNISAIGEREFGSEGSRAGKREASRRSALAAASPTGAIGRASPEPASRDENPATSHAGVSPTVSNAASSATHPPDTTARTRHLNFRARRINARSTPQRTRRLMSRPLRYQLSFRPLHPRMPARAAPRHSPRRPRASPPQQA